MRKTFVWVAILMSLAVQAQVAPKVYASDSRLTMAIGMRAKIVSLADFTLQLQTATKVRFSVSRDIEDRKITAIFHDRPVRVVMKAVEDALFLQWRKSKDGYVLSLPSNVANEEQQLLDAEDRTLRAGLIDGLNYYAEIFGLPKAELDRRDAAFKQQIAALQQDTSTDTQKKSLGMQFQQFALKSTAGPAICKALEGKLPSVVDSLLAGQTVCGSTRAAYAVTPLSTEFMNQVLVKQPDAAAVIVMMRFDPALNEIQGRTVMSSTNERAGNTMFDIFQCRQLLAGSDEVKTSKLALRLSKWQEDPDRSVLDKSIVVEGRKADPPGYVSSSNRAGYTLAEHLEYIADHADIPVIGDAFRIYCSGPMYRPETTVRGYIEGLRQSKHLTRSIQLPPIGYFAARDGWLFVRHNDFWRKALNEIPESRLLPLEEVARTKKFASPEDYAKLVGSLSYLQKSGISTVDSAFKFDPSPLALAFYSLRLWSTLSADQAAATRADGLNLAQLPPTQAAMVRDEVADKMWQGRLPAPIWGPFFSPNGLAGINARLKFRVLDGESHGGTYPNGFPIPVGSREQVNFEYDLTSDVRLSDLYVIASVKSL